jgi:hypothetical protein
MPSYKGTEPHAYKAIIHSRLGNPAPHFVRSSSLVLIPLGLIVLAVLLALIPHKRKLTSAQFADEIERHLLGTDGKWEWDKTISVAIDDERLDRIRWELPKFDSLTEEKDRNELRELIAALRRGEFPGVVPAKHLTYRRR